MTLKRILSSIAATLALCAPVVSQAQFVSLTGTLQSSNGMPASNYTISFTPSQVGFVAGTSVLINASVSCATSTDGSVVGVPNPLQKPPVTVGFTGTLPPANYFVKFSFYDASGNLTLVSPETVIQLNSTGRLIVAPPTSGLPAGASGMKVYVSTTTNAETLQGQTTGSGAFILAMPLTSGASPVSTNTTICKQIANDAIWPTGTGYTVALTDPSGNTLPGYPMQWQLMGPNTTINLSSGLPYYHGTVYFPTPILASPLNHGLQSIAGPLSLSGFNLTNVGALGVGTGSPAWPIDNEAGSTNSKTGYIYNGGTGVTAGQCLVAGSDAFHTFIPGLCYNPTAIFYQTMLANTVPQAQEPALDFSSRFTITDESEPFATHVDLTPTVTAGSCTSCNVTYDAYGRATAFANGGSGPITRTAHNVTSGRVFGTNYQNTNATEMLVSGNGSEIGSGTGTIKCSTGTSNPATDQVWGMIYTATVDLAPAGFACTVPIGYWYRLDMTGSIHPISFGGSASWWEYY